MASSAWRETIPSGKGQNRFFYFLFIYAKFMYFIQRAANQHTLAGGAFCALDKYTKKSE